MQEIITYAIVAVAVVVAARTFLRQFTSREASCSKCPQCGPEDGSTSDEPARLIQIEMKERRE